MQHACHIFWVNQYCTEYIFWEYVNLLLTPFVLACVYLVQATIGIDFLSKTMYLEDRTVRLQLW